METILIIVVVLLIFGGYGLLGQRQNISGGPLYGGGIGLLILILVLLWLFGFLGNGPGWHRW